MWWNRKQKPSEVARPSEPTLFFGDVDHGWHISRLHFAFIGASGAGKSLSLQFLLRDVLRRVGSGVRVIVYDPKTEFMPLLAAMAPPGTPMDLFHIGDMRGKGWKISDSVIDEDTADAVAEILCPRNPKASQPFFENAGRALMSGVMVNFIDCTPQGQDWTFRDVILAMRSRERLEAVLKRTPDGRELWAGYFAKMSTSQDVMSELMNCTKRYRTVAAAFAEAREQVSLVEWAKGSQDGIMVLGRDSRREPACQALNQVLFGELHNLLLSEPIFKDRETWVVIDEVALGKFPAEALMQLCDIGRGLGVRVVICSLGLDSMIKAYDENTTHDILSQTQNVALLRNLSPKTASFASQLFGEYEAFRTQISTQIGPDGKQTTGEIDVLELRKAFLPSEFQTMPVASEFDGFSGVYLSEIGAWRAHITPDITARRLDLPKVDTPRLVKRTKRLKLQPWDEADLHRLGLPVTLLAVPADEQSDDSDKESAPRQETARGSSGLHAAKLREQLVGEKKAEKKPQKKEVRQRQGQRSAEKRRSTSKPQEPDQMPF